jgi:transposase
MRFECPDGFEVRGFLLRLYPTKEDEATFEALQAASRHVWNWLVAQGRTADEARQAYALRAGLVPPKPTPPNYDGMEPQQAKEAAEQHRTSVREWFALLKSATEGEAACSTRSLKDWMAHFGDKYDYQLFQRVLSWHPELMRPTASMLQALGKDWYSKGWKRRRREDDPMPIRTRSGDCFELGAFGARRDNPTFYNCMVHFGRLHIRGRLPGKYPGGRVLEGVSIRKLADGWWASVKVMVPKRVLPDPVPGSVVGIDVGLNNVAAFDDGTVIPNPRGKALDERIAGRAALGKNTARLHQRASRHMRHLIYNQVVKPLARVETIKVEKLSPKVGQMGGSQKKSAMLTTIRLLQERYGDRVREVSPFETSQRCSQCGEKSKDAWSYEAGPVCTCPFCGYSAHRDVNAARNVAAKEAV